MKRRKKKPTLAAKKLTQGSFVEIESPTYSRAHPEGVDGNVRIITVAINVRESPISEMLARGRIDPHQAQAAVMFRELWEAMGGNGVGAIDYSKVHVDGGISPDPISQRRVDAGKKLARCRVKLGDRGYNLVCRVCGEGHFPSTPGMTKREQIAISERLKECLDDLCIVLGLSTRAQPKRRVVQKIA